MRASLALCLAALIGAACSTQPKEDPNTAASLEQLYAQARDEASAGGYDRAIKLYERLEGRASGTPLAQQAQLEVAYLNYRTGEKAQALAAIERFIKLNPSSPALDYAMYLRGLVNFNDNLGLFGALARQDLSERDQKAAKESFEAFRELAERFPDSKYAPDARQRMTYIVNSLAQYEVHVARYYHQRGAHVAAISRARPSGRPDRGATHRPAGAAAIHGGTPRHRTPRLRPAGEGSGRTEGRRWPSVASS